MAAEFVRENIKTQSIDYQSIEKPTFNMLCQQISSPYHILNFSVVFSAKMRTFATVLGKAYRVFSIPTV